MSSLETTKPAASDERKPAIHQAFIFSDNPRLQAILPQGAIICGPEPVEVVLASDYALAESELAEVRSARDQYRDLSIKYGDELNDALKERDELRDELERVKASLATHIDVIGLQDKELCRLRAVSSAALESLEELCGADFCDPVMDGLRAAIDAARGVEG